MTLGWPAKSQRPLRSLTYTSREAWERVHNQPCLQCLLLFLFLFRGKRKKKADGKQLVQLGQTLPHLKSDQRPSVNTSKELQEGWVTLSGYFLSYKSELTQIIREAVDPFVARILSTGYIKAILLKRLQFHFRVSMAHSPRWGCWI